MNVKKLFITAIAMSMGAATPALADLCTANTRCTHYATCFINGKAQPCAYGSSGASSGGVIFAHGTFDVEWLSETRAIVTYGRHREFRAKAQVSTSGGYRILRLSDGVVVKYPISGGHYAGG